MASRKKKKTPAQEAQAARSRALENNRKVLSDLDDLLADEGWALVTHDPVDGPSRTDGMRWVYTVGMFKFGLPEIAVWTKRYEAAKHTANLIADLMYRNEKSYRHGEVVAMMGYAFQMV